MAGPAARSWRDITSGYRLSLVGGAVACFITLVINIAVTIWAGTLPDLDHDGRGRRVLYEGSCSKSKGINTGLHVLINLLSSILLGASNYGIQCLSAPTREQVDKAHARGSYLDIGIVSVRNLGKQSRLTCTLWLTLILSSVPLHLLYNSVVFSSLTVPAQYSIILSDGNVERSLKQFDPRNVLASPGLLDDFNKTGVLERLTPLECINEYTVSFMTSREDVILVQDMPKGTNFSADWDNTSFEYLTSSSEVFHWVCDDDLALYKPCRPQLNDVKARADNWMPYGHRVEYCLSKPIEQQLCRVSFNLWLAVGVIICNFTKMGILAYTALYLAPDRLLVLGDAIQSFISRPDVFSRQSCLVSMRRIRDVAAPGQRLTGWKGERTLLPMRKYWISPVGKSRVAVGVLLYSISLIISLILLIWGINAMETATDFKSLWSLGFGQPQEQTLMSWEGSGSPNIAANVALANLPHLTFSVIYFQWNAIFTSMMIGKEWNDFSLQRTSLRVSDQPHGQQRSRYFLQLPYQFSIPLIATSILLHWILSQCIFIVSVEVFERYVDEPKLSWGLITCGYSPIAIMTVLITSLIIPISVYVLGRRRFPGPMPVAGSCSLAIAAACHHPDGGSHPDATLDSLKWGVMTDVKKLPQGEEQEPGGQELQGLLRSNSAYDPGSVYSDPDSTYEHCGFSNAQVDIPQEGNKYA